MRYRIGARRNKGRKKVFDWLNPRTTSRQGERVEEVLASDLSLLASVLFSLFHLLAQHYGTGVTTRSYERPYRPICSLTITKAMFALEIKGYYKRAQGSRDSPDRTTRQRMPEPITTVPSQQYSDETECLSRTERGTLRR